MNDQAFAVGAINPLSILSWAVEDALEAALKLFGDQEGWVGRQGGYFCLLDPIHNCPELVIAIGVIAPEKRAKYFEFCQEKSRRLADHEDDLSSWQTRHPEQGQWGGAIRTLDQKIFSFSGLPELGDEAVMLAVVMITTADSPEVELIRTWCDEIAALSRNPYWVPLRDALLKSQ